MFNFLHTFNPTPILFQFGPIKIHWYGLFIVIGILAATVVAFKLGEKYGLKKDTIIDTIFYLVIGVLGILAFTIVGLGHRDKVGERYLGQVTSSVMPQLVQTQYIEDSNE